MKFKRFLSTLLVLCCLATLLPVGALPIQATTPENTVSTGSIPFQVNPLYADVFDASALGTELSAPPIKTYGEVAYVSESAGAAAQVEQKAEFTAVGRKLRLIKVSKFAVVHIACELVVPTGESAVAAHSCSSFIRSNTMA